MRENENHGIQRLLAIPGWILVMASCLWAQADVSFIARKDFTLSYGSAPSAILTHDFNGDGHPDLALTNEGRNTVSILLGDGAGGFGPAQDYDVGWNPKAIVGGDFNGDAIMDMAVANSGAGTVSVLYGRAAGGCGESQNTPAIRE